MRKFLLFTILVFSIYHTNAQLAVWDFEGETTTASMVNPDVTAGNAAFGGGVGSVSFPAGNGSTDSYSGNGWSTGALNTMEYIEVSVTPCAGGQMDVTAIGFDERRSGSGPGSWGVRTSLDGFATTVASSTIPDNTSWRTQNAPIPGATALTATLTIRIYGFDAESGAGTWRFDNVNISGTGSGCALPVSISHFTANLQDQSVSLNWTTTSEENNDYFAIEHSTDGITYTEIDYVKGAGNSILENNYEYTHRQAAKGSNYYRLAQIDYNRTINYSSVEVVQVLADELFSLYPTLAKGEVTLQFDEKISRNASVEVFDFTGRRVMFDQLDTHSSNYTFDVSFLQNGNYIVRIQAADLVHTSRFVKF